MFDADGRKGLGDFVDDAEVGEGGSGVCDLQLLGSDVAQWLALRAPAGGPDDETHTGGASSAALVVGTHVVCVRGPV